ncbi:MAG: hypothetical protein ACK5AO_00470 [bacterium]|jgi:aspartate/glutamate racemase
MKKSNNHTRYAIWIDRRHAMILKSGPDSKVSYQEIISDISNRERFDGEKTNKTGMLGITLTPEKRVQAKANNQLHHYVKKVVSQLENANAILILGSGDTRFELHQAIQKTKQLHGVWIENKACKKITRRELELEMEHHYNLHLS